MKPELSRRILEKYRNIKFHENPSSGRRVVARERIDMTKSRFSHFFLSKAPQHWDTISCLARTQTGYYSVTAPLTCSVILLNALKDLESLLCPVTCKWKHSHLPKTLSKIMWWWKMSKKNQPRKITTKSPQTTTNHLILRGPTNQRMRWVELVVREGQMNTFVSETVKSHIGYTASSSLSSPVLWRTAVRTVLPANGGDIRTPTLFQYRLNRPPCWFPHLCPHPRQTHRKQYKTLRLQDLSPSCRS